MFPSRRIAVLGGDSFKDEYSLAFDGVNDVAYTQQHTIDIDGSDCTIGFWLKRDRLATDETIWGNSSGATQNYIMFNSSNQLEIEAAGVANNIKATLKYIDTGWHHYIINFSSTDCEMYQDGIRLTLDKDSINAGDIVLQYLGQYSTSAGTQSFQGNIAELFLYEGTKLTASEVLKVYNGRKPFNHLGWTKTPSAWYRMGDGRLDFNPMSGSSYKGAIENVAGTRRDTAIITDPYFLTNVSANSAGTHWSCGAAWSITGGKLVGSSVPVPSSIDTADPSYADDNLTTMSDVDGLGIGGGCASGQFFKVEYKLSDVTGGNIKFTGPGSFGGVERSGNGEFIESARPTSYDGSFSLYFRCSTSTFTGKVDYVQVTRFPDKSIGPRSGEMMVKESFK